MIPRPWCCVEPRCKPIHQLAEVDLSQPTPGESFFCFGVAPQEITFEYDGAEHRNDLRTCSYTPLKGVVAYQENRNDWHALRNAYVRALDALDREQQS